MTQPQLAARLNVSRSRIAKIEASEVNDSLKLSTLRNAAAALDCELCYFLLPKSDSFEVYLRSQAKKIATDAVKKSAQHMALEDQSAINEIEDQVRFLAEDLIHKKLKSLWDYGV